MKLEDLKVKKSNEKFYDCVVLVPWYGNKIEVLVRFERDDPECDPTPKQLQEFKNLLDKSEDVLTKLEEQLYSYYQKLREENKGEDYFTECFPEVLTPRDLGKYMSFQSIIVSYYEEAWSSYIGFIIDCDWDIELGVGVKLIKNRVREIDVQDIIL